jgi:hypothetical protein
MERLFTQVDLLALFSDIERAIEKQGKFQKVFAPDFKMSRDGCSFTIKVKLKGSRKRPSEITGHGESPWEAATKLISDLDHWVEAW